MALLFYFAQGARMARNKAGGKSEMDLFNGGGFLSLLPELKIILDV
jgi:hypothetical protein